MSEAQTIDQAGVYLDLGGLWVRYDCIGTIKEVPVNDSPYCQVVLTLPGYKTLGVGCTALTLLTAIEEVRSRHEVAVGVDRSKGMRLEA